MPREFPPLNAVEPVKVPSNDDEQDGKIGNLEHKTTTYKIPDLQKIYHDRELGFETEEGLDRKKKIQELIDNLPFDMSSEDEKSFSWALQSEFMDIMQDGGEFNLKRMETWLKDNKPEVFSDNEKLSVFKEQLSMLVDVYRDYMNHQFKYGQDRSM